ncbi:Phosphatase YniC [Serratia fonticola]|uniref:Phosphatase YniC n=1 Tax=Serratia fonticola TaxID=47917 RepID=A0A4U9WHF1_SERFO|nr:Phosphatase YniC [Serratia fonticola]
MLMAYSQRIATAIFDMDGLLIDSEPLWLQAEMDIFSSLGLDLSDRHKLPDTLGLRIDLVVRMWFQAMPCKDPLRRKSLAALSSGPSSWYGKSARCCLGCNKRWNCAVAWI